MGLQELRTFAFAYLKSMRLYYAFITGIAGWIGVSFYSFLALRDPQLGISSPDMRHSVVILTLLFASWGINQIFNDWLGLPEDRINAPNRPMVNGELNVRWALATSYFLMTIAGIISWFLNPLAVIPLVVGFLLNFVYEYSKAWGLWGNVVFGLMISNCTVYGFLGAGPTPDPVFTSSRLCTLFLVGLMNGLMTFYTYFKDYKGDRAAGKDTFIVRHGLRTARLVGVAGAFLPTLAFLAFRWAGWLPFEYTDYFIYCSVMTIFLQFWTAVRFYVYPIGPQAYFSNATNFRACACGQVTLISMFNGPLALYLFSTTYVFVGFLFDLHGDAKG